ARHSPRRAPEVVGSQRSPRARRLEPEDCQPLVDEAALREHRDGKTAPTYLLEKALGVAEGRQHHQSRAARLEVLAQARGEAFGDVRRAPRAVAVVARRA